MSRHGRPETGTTEATGAKYTDDNNRTANTCNEEISITHRIIAFERYNLICRKQSKNKTLEQFHSDLVELAIRANCGDREND